MVQIGPQGNEEDVVSGPRLVEWRARYGWSRSEAAKMLGTPVSTVRNWERGRSPIPQYAQLLCWYVDRYHELLRAMGSIAISPADAETIAKTTFAEHEANMLA